MRSTFSVSNPFFAIICGVTSLLAQSPQPQPQQVSPSANPEIGVYGIQLGTLSGSFGFGGAHVGGLSGVHPAILGSFDVGLGRYIGVYGEGSWMRLISVNSFSNCATNCNVSANGAVADGGLEVVGTNRSRIVPYGKFGAGYLRNGIGGSVSGIQVISQSINHVAIVGAGGVRAYVNRHFGIDGQVRYVRSLAGNNGGNNYVMFTVGVFGQTK